MVDRGTWIDSNIDGFRLVLAPLLERMATENPSVVTPRSGSRVTALQMGGVLGYLSGKVLGQFEAFTTAREGRLLLVAPNIVAAERTSTSSRATSGSGSACTRRPTACSSAACRGSAGTSSRRSTTTSRSPTRARCRP